MIQTTSILLFVFAIIALVQYVHLAPIDAPSLQTTEVERIDIEKRYVKLGDLDLMHTPLTSDNDEQHHLEARNCKDKKKKTNAKKTQNKSKKQQPKKKKQQPKKKKQPKKKTPPKGKPSGTRFSGDGTYFFPALGSCGSNNDAHDMIAALNAPQMGQVPNPNKNPNCGRFAKVTGPKGTVTVKIVDTCPPCLKGSLDLSPAAFKKIADLDQGRVPISWQWV